MRMEFELTGEEDTPIGAMPGCYRLGWRHGLVEEVLSATVYVSLTVMHDINESLVCLEFFILLLGSSILVWKI